MQRQRHSQHSTCWHIVQFTKCGETETTSVASTGPLQFTNDRETETLTVFRYTDKIISLSMVKKQRHSPCSICWHIPQFTKWWRERDTVLHLLTYSTVRRCWRDRDKMFHMFTYSTAHLWRIERDTVFYMLTYFTGPRQFINGGGRDTYSVLHVDVFRSSPIIGRQR